MRESVAFSDFVRRQTPDSKFSHWDISDVGVIDLIIGNWSRRRFGYRPEVVLVPVDPDGFFTGVVNLQEGDNLRGSFMPRQKGEAPRQTFCLDTRDREGVSANPRDRKAPAAAVDIVLYSREALLEDLKPGEEPPTADWNIISVNASPVLGEAPIRPEVLMANHFHDDGGTATNMDDTMFTDALRLAYFYWKDKTFIG